MIGGKILAIDYGRKRVGVATGDGELAIAFPQKVLANEGMDGLVSAIAEVFEDFGCDSVVLGLPLNMEGYEENEVLEDVKVLVDKLKERLKCEVDLVDERLSSFEADQLIGDLMDKDAKNHLGRDAYAAQVILQRFFDRMHGT